MPHEIASFDDEAIKGYVGKLVLSTVQETINALLDEEAMMEMYLAGVSARRIEDVSEILWGSSVSKGTVSNLNQKAFAAVEAWGTRPLACAYVFSQVSLSEMCKHFFRV
jgi:transposase-like protein